MTATYDLPKTGGSKIRHIIYQFHPNLPVNKEVISTNSPFNTDSPIWHYCTWPVKNWQAFPMIFIVNKNIILLSYTYATIFKTITENGSSITLSRQTEP